jgi:uncharacterized protein YraI
MKNQARSLLIAAALGLAATAALAATLTVMVQQTQMRSRPQFFAPAVATVKLGQKLQSDEDAQNGWYQVTSGGSSGWVHESAVTSKKVKLASRSAGDSGTSAEEITLAGKGFNEQVESQYKAGHANLDFTKVDAMEKRVVPDDSLLPFMRSGGLLPQTAKAGAR